MLVTLNFVFTLILIMLILVSVILSKMSYYFQVLLHRFFCNLIDPKWNVNLKIIAYL